MAWPSSLRFAWLDWLDPQSLASVVGLVALGIAASAVVALLLVKRTRSRFAKQAQLIAEANRRFQATFDQAAVGISHIDPRGRWIRANNRFCEITGFAPEELLERTVADITHPDDVERDLAAIDALLSGAIPQSALEKRYLTKGGAAVWVNVTRSVVRDEHGEVEFFVAVAEDITSRKQAEERLRLLQNDYAHLARVTELGEMAAAIAHEINQPLAAIVNYLNSGRYVAQQGHSETSFSQIGADMDRASEQALRAGEIVRRLRAFISQGTGTRTEEPLEALLDAAMELALIDVKSSGIRVERQIETAGMVVEVDAIQIHQVLVNLMRNAVDAMNLSPADTERRLIIKAREDGDLAVSVTIADTGPGIAPDVYERLFQPFVTSKSNGMGMGLSVCQRLIEAHGGTIRAANRPQSGAEFTFCLPRIVRNGTAQ